MKFDIYNGGYIGTAEWRNPGEVVVEIEDPDQRRWFEDYFATEETFLGGPIDAPQMTSVRRDSSEEAFAHSAFELSAYHYTVRDGAESSPQGAGET